VEVKTFAIMVSKLSWSSYLDSIETLSLIISVRETRDGSRKEVSNSGNWEPGR